MLFSFLSIHQYHHELKEGICTCESAVTFFLEQINLQKHLNAFVNVYADEAIAKARQLDANRKNHPHIPLKKLHGVVISLKDVICYKNHPVTAASKMLHGFTSLYNATVVEKLLEEDAIIIGHTNCDEFAMGSGNENSFYGPTLNAIDTHKVPGGSSGGSAVAVQSHCSMISLGSDTGGSVRQPANYCGVVGVKPTYGRVSRFGLIAYASSFDQIGILSKTIEDAEITLEVIAGKDDHDTTSFDEVFHSMQVTKTPKKIAYFTDVIDHSLLDDEIKKAFMTTINELKSKGHQVEAIQFPLLEFLVPTYYILTTAEASSNLNRYDGVAFGYRAKGPFENLNDMYEKTRTEGFGVEVQKRILLGSFVLSSGYYDAYYTKAQKVRQQLRSFIEKVLLNADFILMPNAPTTAPNIGDKEKDPIAVYLSDIYTVLANLVGIPAMSIPLATHSNGMPFGIQILAAHKQEAAMLAFAKELSFIKN